jgi:tRNA(fMet)-specific endonuclease VapC
VLKSKRPIDERSKVDHIINPIGLVPFEGDAVEHDALIRCELEKAGTPIGPNDLLIAATARSIGAVMVTSTTFWPI